MKQSNRTCPLSVGSDLFSALCLQGASVIPMFSNWVSLPSTASRAPRQSLLDRFLRCDGPIRHLRVAHAGIALLASPAVRRVTLGPLGDARRARFALDYDFTMRRVL